MFSVRKQEFKAENQKAAKPPQPVEKPLHSEKKECGEAADAFFASFLGTKKEVGNGGKAPNTPT